MHQPSQLTITQLQWIDTQCIAFESAIKSGAAPSIETYLDRVQAASQSADSAQHVRKALLRELLALEVEYRRPSECPNADHYVERFPTDQELVHSVLRSTEVSQDSRANDTERLDALPAPEVPALRVRCPHCHQPMKIVDNDSLDDVTCASCGSSFSLIASTDTHTHRLNQNRRIREFELLDTVGVGQFGTVWKARDIQLQRLVAIKIPRRGSLDTNEVEFFFREARAAAQLRHANIVSVHEAGREDDTIFIVSDYIDGASLKEWLTGQQPSVFESVQLCIKVANALEHAHESGVVHRDLKPGNIMMDRTGEPHVTDFGLAKRETGEVTMTMDGHLVGTPAYMPPEQARGEGHRADRRSDVYSLGVVLFELLTGELPFRGQQRMLIVQILDEEPPSPRKFNPQVPRDLETICLKCLEKSPERRYQTSADLERDLQRFLDGKPVHARPITRAERWWRVCKRNAVVSGLSAGLALILVVGIGISGYLAIRESDRASELAAAQTELVSARDEARDSAKRESTARQKTESALRVSQKSIADLNTRMGLDAIRSGDPHGASLWFAAAANQTPFDEHRQWVNHYRAWDTLRQLPLPIAHGRLGIKLEEMVFHPLHEYLLGRPMKTSESSQIFHLPNNSWLSVHGHAAFSAAAWDATGERLAVGIVNEVKLVTFDQLEPLLSIPVEGVCQFIEFLPRRDRLVLVCQDLVRVWDLQADQLYSETRFSNPVVNLSVDPTGRHVAVVTDEKRIHLLKVTDDDTEIVWEGASDTRDDVTPQKPRFSSDGEYLLYAYDGSTLARRSVTSPSIATEFRTGIHFCWQFAPQGKAFVVGTNSGVILIQDDGAEQLLFVGHDVKWVEWRRDFEIRFAGADNTVKAVHVGSNKVRSLVWEFIGTQQCASSSDNGLLAVASQFNDVTIWSLTDHAPARDFNIDSSAPASHAAFSSDSRHVARVSLGGDVRVFSLATQTAAAPPISPEGAVVDVTFLQAGDDLVTVSIIGDDEVSVDSWNWRNATRQRPSLRLQYHETEQDNRGDGKWDIDRANDRLAVANRTGSVTLIDLESLKILRTLDVGAPLRYVRFSPQGRWLCSFGAREAVFYDMVDLNAPKCEVPIGMVTGQCPVEFAPDEVHACIRETPDTLRFLNLETGEVQSARMRHPYVVKRSVYSDDGTLLVTSCTDGQLRVWHTSDGTMVGAPMSSNDAAVSFVAGDRLVAAADNSGELVFFDWVTGLRAGASVPIGADNWYTHDGARKISVSPDRNWMAVGGRPETTVVDLSHFATAESADETEIAALAELVAYRSTRNSSLLNIDVAQWKRRYEETKEMPALAARQAHLWNPGRRGQATLKIDPVAEAIDLLERTLRDSENPTPVLQTLVDGLVNDLQRRIGNEPAEELLANALSVCQEFAKAPPDNDNWMRAYVWLLDHQAEVTSVVLLPVRAESRNGAQLAVEADGSVFASGRLTDDDVYDIEVSCPVAELKAIRLEALPDARLPSGGPGRGGGGNFLLTGIRVFALDPQDPVNWVPLELSHPRWDFSQVGGLRQIFADKPWHGWGIYPQVGQPHSLEFDVDGLESPLHEDLRLRLELRFQNNEYRQEPLGRFRLVAALPALGFVPRIVRRDPRSMEVTPRLALAEALLHSGQPDEALALLENSRNKSMSRRTIYESLLRGAAHLALGDREQTLKELTTAADDSDLESPNGKSLELACFLAARLYPAIDQHHVLEFISRHVNESHRLLFLRSELNARFHGRWDLAAADLERILQVSPANTYIRLRLTLLLLKQGETQALAEHLRETLDCVAGAGGELHPQQGMMLAYAALITELQDSEQTTKAFALVESARNEEPGHGWNHLIYVLGLYRLHRLEEARELFVRSETQLPDSFYAVVLTVCRSMVEQRLGNSEKAAEMLDEARALLARLAPLPDGDNGTSWQDRIAAESLLKEAEALIDGERVPEGDPEA